LGGLLWKLLGKRVYLWRNHYEGSWLTALAVSLCDKVFCTSKHSYTARFGKTVLMPVGIDTSVFKRDESVVRQPRSILFLARMSPSKKPDVLIEALGTMKRGRIAFKASLYGDAPPHDSTYYDGLKERVRELGISAETTFHTGIPNTQTPAIYQAHDIFVNLSRAGMFDKTIGEAMACDCLVATSNDAVKSVVGDAFISKPSSEHVAGVLARLLALSPSERERRSRTAAEFIEYEHSLSLLAQRLFGILGS
jgi:glycosyltransferase involved in cell wall biosynthesis